MGSTTDRVRVWRDLLVLHARVMDDLAAAFEADHELSISEFDVLVNLDPSAAMRHGDLAERVILSRTALTRLIDRLARRGFVARQPDPQDQRAVQIALTDAGRAIRRQAARTNARIVAQHFATLNAAELTQLDVLVKRLDPNDVAASPLVGSPRTEARSIHPSLLTTSPGALS